MITKLKSTFITFVQRVAFGTTYIYLSYDTKVVIFGSNNGGLPFNIEFMGDYPNMDAAPVIVGIPKTTITIKLYVYVSS